MNTILEHDREAEPGIPEPLPATESLRWRGGPDYRSFLFGSFRFGTLAFYFGALLALQFGVALYQGQPTTAALGATAGYAMLATFALFLVAGYAWLSARSSVFTITSERVIVRTGVALPVSINLPYGLIESADLKLYGDGSGDISLVPERSSRVSWLLTWPMVKQLRLVRVQPVLRGIADAGKVAGILAEALGQSTDRPAVASKVEEPVPATADEPRSGFRPYPTIPLAAMVSLVCLSLVGVAWKVYTDTGVPEIETISFASEVELYFDDQPDGAVVVRRADDNSTVDVLPATTNGFVRATMRGLVRARAAVGAGSEEPFTVGATEQGRIVLFDPVSGRRIDLRAFGQTNEAAFAKFIQAAPETTADTLSETTVALKQEEATR